MNTYQTLFLALVADTFRTGQPFHATAHDTVLPKSWAIGKTNPQGEYGSVGIVFQNVGGVPAYFTEGNYAETRNARVQVIVWAASPGDRTIATDMLLRAVAKHPNMEPLTEAVDQYDRTVELYGSQFDLSCWWTRD